MSGVDSSTARKVILRLNVLCALACGVATVSLADRRHEGTEARRDEGTMEAIEKPDESSPTLASTTEHGATVAGRVTVKSKRRLPQTVLYIEPVDPVRRFQPPANEIVVSQRGAKFSPSLLVISVGQTVEFRNDENRPIEGKVNIFNLAKNAGTSVEQIERFYAKHLPLSREMAKNLQSFGGG